MRLYGQTILFTVVLIAFVNFTPNQYTLHSAKRFVAAYGLQERHEDSNAVRYAMSLLRETSIDALPEALQSLIDKVLYPTDDISYVVVFVCVSTLHKAVLCTPI
jgi:hypothetical protein